MDTQQAVLWRLRNKGLKVSPDDLNNAYRSGKLRRPRKNSAGHFMYTEADERAIEAHLREKRK